MSDTVSIHNTPPLPLARVFVFCVSAVVMLIELTASRSLAPVLGSSITTWTSVIVVMLLGYTLGAVVGGRLADWKPRSKVMLAVSTIVSAAWLGVLPWLVGSVGTLLVGSSWSLSMASLVFCALVFFLPAFFLSMVYPQILKFGLQRLGETGRTMAGIGSWNAAGSILGTYVTGYVLLQFVSLSTMSWGAAIVLLVATASLFVSVKKEEALDEAVEIEPTRLEVTETVPALPLIVFVTGFVLMSLQMLSGRVMAPFLGYSLFTWTSVIGATLLGIVLGYQIGGRWADRQLSRELVAKVVGMAGILLLISLYLTVMLGSLFTVLTWSLSMKTALFALIVFFPPTLLISMSTPMLFRFGIRRLETAGTRYGSLGAWSALGNILGVALTGYVLVPWMGTRVLVLVLSLLLLGLALVLSSKRRELARQRLSWIAIPLLIGVWCLPQICEVESRYYCIRAVEQIREGQPKAHVLKLDHLVHSYVNEGHPERLGYGYEQVYASLIASRYAPTSTFSSFFIGGGGYVMPRYLEAFYPSSMSLVAEIDPAVTKFNHDRLGLSATTSIQTVNEDARYALLRMPSSTQMDLVFGDAFNDFGVPSHLTTVEFHHLLKTKMKPDGVYALNMIDDLEYGHFFSAMFRTLGKVWKHVYVVTGADTLKPGRNTIVLLATDVELSESILQTVKVFSNNEFDGKLISRAEFIRFISPEEVSAFVQAHDVPVLQDAFVPLDRYLANVFRDAY